MAKKIPGKEEFNEILNYFNFQLKKYGVTIHLNHEATATELLKNNYDTIVLATGATARIPEITGITHPKVLSYSDVILHQKPVGQKVAIIGGGGIAFDMALLLSDPGYNTSQNKDLFLQEWGINKNYTENGGLTTKNPKLNKNPRTITMLKRSPGKFGVMLGKTTGWIHRETLNQRGITQLNRVTYKKIDDTGLHIEVNGTPHLLNVDHIIPCTGQIPQTNLNTQLKKNHPKIITIGCCTSTEPLDAEKAINQSCHLAASL